MRKLIPYLLEALIRLLSLTIRFRMHDPTGFLKQAAPPGVIWIFWHNRIIGSTLTRFHDLADRRCAILTSPSRDGELIATVMRRLGMEVVRGSSSRRGSMALMELLTHLENGTDAIVTPDGPRGPCYRMSKGVLQLARWSGRPIVPANIEYSRYWTLKSWDRFRIPKPFSTVTTTLGPLLDYGSFGKDAPDAAIEAELERLEKQLIT